MLQIKIRKAVLKLLLLTFSAISLNALSWPALAQSSASDESRITALRNTIQMMTAETQQLEDIAQIHRLQRAYGYYIDKGYWNEAADLFADDASMEIGVDGVYHGQARIRELLIRHGGGNNSTGPGLPFGQINHHMQLQPVVTIAEDGQSAYARWRDFSLLGQYQESAFWADAIMENVYSKADGIWKIQSFHLFPNFVAPYEGGWASLEPVAQDWRSDIAMEFPADANPTVIYKPFPDVFVPPFHYENPAQANSAVANIPLPENQGGAIGELEEMVIAYAHELDNLRMEKSLENLQAMYGYYIDKGMWDEAASLFAEDATYEFGQGGVYIGAERIKAVMSRMAPEGLAQGVLNNYPMLQPIISVAEDNLSAKARWRSDVQLNNNEESFWGGGVYENEYVIENGIWKISKLHYYVTFWAEYDKGWIDGTVPMANPNQEFPPDLPPTEVYGSQPEVYLFPFHYPHLVTGEEHRGKGEEQ
ncbi:nuclear transport factor 2 family protein [Gammaproteobacteria bacterium]|nr:nuclear transport factor 2 family protein [Gammaproteobacteria bacterium]